MDYLEVGWLVLSGEGVEDAAKVLSGPSDALNRVTKLLVLGLSDSNLQFLASSDDHSQLVGGVQEVLLLLRVGLLVKQHSLLVSTPVSVCLVQIRQIALSNFIGVVRPHLWNI